MPTNSTQLFSSIYVAQKVNSYIVAMTLTGRLEASPGKQRPYESAILRRDTTRVVNNNILDEV